ncbi:MAG: ATP-binding protein [Magnetococcus sp. YQC-9]
MELTNFVRRLWLTVLLINLLVGGLAIFTIQSGWNTYAESSKISTQNLALMLEREIASFIANVDLSLLSMADDYAERPSPDELPVKNWNEQRRRQQAILPILADLGAINDRGVVIWGQVVDNPLRADVSDHEYFIMHRDNPDAGLVMSSLIFARDKQQRSLVFARRLNDANGHFIGIIAATIALQALYERFAALELGQNGSIAMRDEKVRLVLRYPKLPDDGEIGSTRISDEFKAALAQDATQGSYRAGATSIDGVRRYHSYRRNPKHAFYINVGLSEEEHFSAWRDEMRWTYGFMALFLLATFGMAFWLGRTWQFRQNAMIQQAIAENALRDALNQAKHLTDALDHTPSYIYIKNKKHQYVYANTHTLKLFGCTAEELIGCDDTRFFPSVAVKSIWEVDNRVLEQGIATQMEIEVAPGTPEWRVYWELKQPLIDGNGHIWGLCGISTDITDRKRIENELKHSEQTYRSLFDNMLNGFALHEIILDDAGQPQDYRFLEVNQAFTKMTGLNPSEVVGHTVLEVMPRTEPFWIETYGRVALTSQPTHIQNYSQETGKHFEVFAYSPQERQFATIIEDITKRKQAEATLLREKEVQETLARLARSFLVSQGSGIEEIAQHVLDASLEVTESLCGFVNEIDLHTGRCVNRAISTTTCSICEKMKQSIFSQEANGLWGWGLEHRQTSLNNAPSEYTSFIGTPDDHIPVSRFLSVPVLSGKNLVAQIVVVNGVRDYTQDDILAMERIASLLAVALERVKLERQLRHAGKLEAIGTLSAGIAHDFNNILGIILGFSEIALRNISPQDRVYGFLQEIVTAGIRAKGLVDQLLTFSRKSDSPRQPLLLSVLVKEVAKFFRASVPSSIDIDTRVEKGDLVVKGNTDQIHQLLMNLCSNALQAIPHEQGMIRISLERVQVAEGEPGINLAAGNYALLQVQDTGTGMPPEILEHIFEPFFTTKDIGKGTGLGLSVVHGIVTNHGGAINVTSTPETGSVFRVWLPLLAKGVTMDLALDSAPPLHRGTGTLLVVDDEPQLLSIYQESLSSLGYEVISKTGAPDALRVFAANPDHFSALVTDYAMPQMTGVELAHKVKEIRPEVPVLLCTGLGSDGFQATAQDAVIDIVLHKPVPVWRFSEILAKLLSENRG